MKIKIVLITLLAAALVLGAAACGPTEREQEYIDAARAVAEEIPLPDWYCPVHGLAGEPGEIKVELLGYASTTGEPTFEITCKVRCPEFAIWPWSCGQLRKFYLTAKYKFTFDDVDYYWTCDWPDVKASVTLSELTDDTITKYWR